MPYDLPTPSVPTKKTAEVISFAAERDMVTMGAPYLSLERPTVDWQAARGLAAEFCLAQFGMSHAEPVGATRRECLTFAGTDCIRFAIVGDYQCSR